VQLRLLIVEIERKSLQKRGVHIWIRFSNPTSRKHSQLILARNFPSEGFLCAQYNCLAMVYVQAWRFANAKPPYICLFIFDFYDLGCLCQIADEKKDQCVGWATLFCPPFLSAKSEQTIKLFLIRKEL
jgi:hypothetical protein